MCANGPHEPDAWLKRPHKPAPWAGQDQLRHSAIAARPPASDASAPQEKQGWGEGGRGPPGPCPGGLSALCPAPVVPTAPAPGRGLRLPEVRHLRTTVTCAWQTQDVAAPGVGPGRPSSSLCLPHAPRRPSSLTRTHRTSELGATCVRSVVPEADRGPRACDAAAGPERTGPCGPARRASLAETGPPRLARGDSCPNTHVALMFP